LRIGCEFRNQLEWPVPAVLQVEPYPRASVTVTATFAIDPPVPTEQYVDLYGNLCRRFVLGPGPTHIHFEAEVEVEAGVDEANPEAIQHSVADLPSDVLHFTLPSRFCQSDTLSNTAWQLFGEVPEGWQRAQAVVDWVHQNITFVHASSGPSTTAVETYLQRRGVCRDFTHLGITFLRALNIPARYCFGYLPDIDVPVLEEPMDFVGWLEAYLGGRWYILDPRNNTRRTGRVLIGRGRDALDVAMLTTYGLAPLTAMRVMAEPIEAEPWSSALPPVVGSFAQAPL
jgi:transglutaminase-like putative cysteine protease